MKKPYTETEIRESKEQDLFIVEKQLTSDKLSLDELNYYMPGFLHLNKISTLALDYVTNTVEKNLGISKQRVSEDGFGVVVDVVHPLDLEPCIRRCRALYEQQDPIAITSFLQRIRPLGKKEYEVFFTSTKLFGKSGQSISISIPVRGGEFAHGLNRLLGDFDFLRKNYRKFSNLTAREQEVLRFVALGKSNKQIAEIITISENTVRTHRNRIWIKLGIKHINEAVKYAQVFELI